MKLKIILLLFLTGSAVSNEIIAQTINGDWYTILRNKLLHIIISKDSVIFTKCSFDIEMQDYGYVDMAFRVEKVVNNNYIVRGTKDTVPTFHLLNFKLNNGKNNLNIESLNYNFPTLTDAENSILLIEPPPMNIILVDKATVDKTRKQRDLSTMTTNDFKNYALKIMEQDSITANYVRKKYKLSYLYQESTARIILSETGFNSLVKGNVFDTALEKFAENPETKELFLKMTGK